MADTSNKSSLHSDDMDELEDDDEEEEEVEEAHLRAASQTKRKHSSSGSAKSSPSSSKLKKDSSDSSSGSGSKSHNHHQHKGGSNALARLPFTARFTKSFKKYLVQPFLVGCAVAFGMSLGYAIYDSVAYRVATLWKWRS